VAAWQFGYFINERISDLLHDQLGNAVTSSHLDGVSAVVVDQNNTDLTAIPSVDYARGVHHS
jgi:hypothetical protein